AAGATYICHPRRAGIPPMVKTSGAGGATDDAPLTSFGLRSRSHPQVQGSAIIQTATVMTQVSLVAPSNATEAAASIRYRGWEPLRKRRIATTTPRVKKTKRIS